jgi:hypothetical protein
MNNSTTQVPGATGYEYFFIAEEIHCKRICYRRDKTYPVTLLTLQMNRYFGLDESFSYNQYFQPPVQSKGAGRFTASMRA